MPNPLQSFAEAKAPPRNKLMGLVADALTRANEFATMQDPRYGDKRQNQTLGILADVLGLGSIAKTADRLSYGDPLTNAKKANVPFLKPETADALMMAPLSPRTAMAAMGMGMGDNALTRAATVWHGSPHKFDKFDSSKIGTGEGAQAYGHGLYLADAEDVSKAYMRAGETAAPIQYQGQGIMNWALGNRDAVKTLPKPTQKALAYARDFSSVDEARRMAAAYDMPEVAAEIDRLARVGELTDSPAGNLYKVDLPDEKIARMLDWDKPLSQQAPEVQEALRVAVKPGWVTGAMGERKWLDPFQKNATGGKLLEMMQQLQRGQPEERLKASGIPGIRYLDGGSRGAGAGSSNYVVFAGEEEALKILERNGIPVR
jgi:hypothetical protein